MKEVEIFIDGKRNMFLLSNKNIKKVLKLAMDLAGEE